MSVVDWLRRKKQQDYQLSEELRREMAKISKEIDDRIKKREEMRQALESSYGVDSVVEPFTVVRT
jgi:flagellar motility protein MotE (MotC chaperone)